MIDQLKELWQYRHLIPMFVERDIKARYKQTTVGIAWAIIQPLFMMLVLNLIFSKLLSVSTGGVAYPLFSFAVLVPWTFFQRSMTASSESLLANSSIITKIYFPREIIPISTVISSLLDYFIGIVVFILMLLIYRSPISLNIIYYPLLLIIQLLLAITLSLITSSISVIMRDLKFALPLFVQIWMYASPVIYGVSRLKSTYKDLLLLNPVTGILESYRNIFLYNQPPAWNYLLVSILFSLFGIYISYMLFKKIETYFVDIL